MVLNDILKIPIKYNCIDCDYITCSKKDYNKHCKTVKHQKGTNGIFLSQKIPPTYTCNCGKIYQFPSGLYRHKKNCIQNNVEIDNNNILYIIQQNQEFKELLLEQNHQNNLLNKQNQDLTMQLIEVSKNSKNINSNNHNSHNNKFNINLFLNEECKDALNITDFVSSLTLKLTELEEVGKLGYAEGISKIFIRGLKELDINKRPIHCSDLKRETMYIKDENNWEKEDMEKMKLQKAIKQIARKNIENISEWSENNPNSKNSSDIKNDEYMKIISESMGGLNANENKDNMNKIIKNVAKQVFINK